MLCLKKKSAAILFFLGTKSQFYNTNNKTKAKKTKKVIKKGKIFSPAQK